MMEILEYIVLFTIGVFQLVITIQLLSKIKDYSNLFSEKFRIQALRVPVKSLKEIHEEIDKRFIGRGHFQADKLKEAAVVEYEDRGVELSSDSNNLYFQRIIKTINSYLNKNYGTTVDFHILKDIVERITNTDEEAIASKMQAPLYLGLVATMIGIIIGFWGIGDLTEGTNQIKPLIDGVKWAMSFSVLGLILSIFLSTIVFKKARTKVEVEKNDFLSFLQTELLPKMTISQDAGIDKLSYQLNDFGYKTTEIVASLDTIVDKTNESIKKEHQLIEELKQLDLNKINSANKLIFSQLSKMMIDFKAFPDYYAGLNASLDKTTTLNNNLIKFTEQTANVNIILENLKAIVEDSKNASDFFSKHIKSFVQYEENVNIAVASADDKMKQSLDYLKEAVAKQIDSYTVIIDEYENKVDKILEKSMSKYGDAVANQIQNMNEAFDKSRPKFEKLNKLDDIEKQLKILNNNIENQGAHDYQDSSLTLSNSSLPIQKIFGKISLKELNDYLRLGAYGFVVLYGAFYSLFLLFDFILIIFF